MRQKRFLSWLLTLCLLLGMFSFPAYAEGNTATTTISGDGTAEKTGTMTVTLVIPKKTPAAADLTYTAPSDLVYSGSNKAATIAAASGVTGLGTITVKYYSDAARTTEATPKNVGTYYVGATIAEGDQYAASTGVLYGDGWTFTITASTPTAPAAPTKASATKNSITLNAVSGCEYSKDGTNWQDSPSFSGLVPGTEYTFYQRVKETTNTNASSASSASFSTEADTYAMTITLTIKEMEASAEDVSAAYDGQPHGITVNVTDPDSGYTVKYGTTEGTYDLDASPTQTEVGSQTVYYQVTANNYVTKTGSATVTISEANAVAATVTANNRTYDGTDKPLVNVDNSTLVGGEMYYATGDANGATQPYTTSIPTATNAGTYYVWYKVVGDENHTDSDAGCVTVTIAEAAEEPSEDNGAVNVPEDKQKGNFATGGLDNSASEIQSIVLDDADKAAIAAGKDVDVWLEVNDNTATVTEAEKEMVENTVAESLGSDYQVGSYLDLTLWKQITGEEQTKVTNVQNGKVKVSLTVPSSLQKAGRIYKIARIHNGVTSILDTVLNAANFKLTFETDKFSTYALVYSDSTEASAVEPTPELVPVTDWLEPFRVQLHIAGELGGEQTVEFSGDFALPLEFMQYLQGHPQITLIYHVTYEGEEFTVTIPGEYVVADPEINWYGPLWLKGHFGEGVNPGTAKASGANGTYIVKKDDTLTIIAKMFGTTVNALVEKNDIKNKDLIYPGQEIKY